MAGRPDAADGIVMHRAGSSVVGAALVALGLAIGPSTAFVGASSPGRSSEPAEARQAHEETLGDGPGCAPSAPDDGEAAAPDSDDHRVTIAVTVPATTLVRVDRRGRVTAAMSNTGCRPQLSDDIWVLRSGAEEIEPASLSFARAVVAQRWPGRWQEPGVWHRPAGHSSDTH